MKLYATVTSERASEGQGGQEYIECKMTVDDGKRIACRVEVFYGTDGRLKLKTQDCMGNEHYEDIDIKGNKQKDSACPTCKKDWTRYDHTGCIAQ